MEKYEPKNIERKWQEKWESARLYQDYSRAKKFYALNMFPYPSGAGLHVGHPKGNIATDIFARFKMLNGFSVLHPMGWDAFGLPAENYAIKNKVHPSVAVAENIATFKKQLEAFGFTYDWNREINTTDPQYYKWTQWIFLKMFEKGLAYESNEPVNWCPSCKTVLSNEDLEDGLCERCGSQVVQKRLRQWVLKMTDYADRLLADLDSPEFDWEPSIIEQQKNWIGKSEGATVSFEIKISNEIQNSNDKNSKQFIEVFTTRVDTIFGCTYCVVAPEHSIISNFKFQISNYSEVEAYVIASQNKTILERTQLQKEKTGVKLEGVEVINPFNNEAVPLFVADYVLGGYGTGAVMAVPAHDERDFEFAKKYSLPIREVIMPENLEIVGSGAFLRGKNGKFIFHKRDNNTDRYPGMIAPFAGGIEDGESPLICLKREMIEEIGIDISAKHIFSIGKFESRFESGKYVNLYFIDNIDSKEINVGEGDGFLELSLNEALTEEKVTDYTKEVIKYFQEKNNFAFTEDGKLIDSESYSGLTSVEAREKMMAWLEEKKLGKKKVNFKMRDWIFSRQRYWGEPIPIVHCEKCGAVGVPEEQLPVRLPEVKNYEPTGTGEGPLANITDWVNTTCPKCGGPAKRETNTMPQWAGSSWYYLRYIDPKNETKLINQELEKDWMPVDLYVGGAEHATRHLLYARFWHKFLFDIGVVTTKEPFKKLMHVGLILAEDGRKMSKRWGNVINPDDIISQFGADSMRLYEMFMGPFSQSVSWNTNGVSGVRKFLEKVWKLQEKVSNNQELTTSKSKNIIHKTIKKVTGDIENFRFNTAISQLMILVNSLEKEQSISVTDYQLLITILSPFAPHIAEELWQKLGNEQSIFLQTWPVAEDKYLKDEEIEMVVQVNGKVRERLMVSPDVTEDEIKETALENEKVKIFIAGKEIKKIIFVPEKLINIVVS
ncbi:MAG: leucine--tRNA ligase [Candidatus Moranbacteria bacterium]|nr:leucine--tRNA ligase [Candidatus Moranbacteria bacterium]